MSPRASAIGREGYVNVIKQPTGSDTHSRHKTTFKRVSVQVGEAVQCVRSVSQLRRFRVRIPVGHLETFKYIQ